jgi:AcrR family transcriptional regulator
VLSEVTKGERTKSEILAAAFALFAEQGYHGTSMRQVAERADIALGGIYNHFNGKEDVFEQVVLNYHPIHEVLPEIEMMDDETIEQLLRRAAHRMVAQLRMEENYIKLLFIEIVEFEMRHLPHLVELMLPRIMVFAQKLIQERSDLRPVPVGAIVRMFLGTVFTYYFSETFIVPYGKMFFGETDGLDQMLDVYFHGILADTAGEGEDR